MSSSTRERSCPSARPRRWAKAAQVRAVGAGALALLLAATGACAEKPAKKAAPGPEATPNEDEEKKAPLIDLMSLNISQQGRPIARLFPDGRTQGTEPDSSGKPAYWVPGPTLRSDGTILLTKGGLTAKLEDSGEIYVVNSPGKIPREQLFGRISGNQLAFANSEKPWAVRIEGNTIEFNGPGFDNKIEGEVDARARRTALVMTAAFFLDLSIPRGAGHPGSAGHPD